MTTIEWVSNTKEAKAILLSKGINITKIKKGKYHASTTTDHTMIYNLYDGKRWIAIYHKDIKQLFLLN